jgi:hypothetical protein
MLSRRMEPSASPALDLTLLPGRLAVCRLLPEAPLPAPAAALPLWSVTRTAEELSLILPEAAVPAGARAETGFRALKVEGPLAFSAVGILAGLTRALAAAGVSLFALSTFDTDYLLVREGDLERATTALAAAGHKVAR